MRDAPENFDGVLHFETGWLEKFIIPISVSLVDILDKAEVGRRCELQKISKVDNNWDAAEVMMRLLVTGLANLVISTSTMH